MRDLTKALGVDKEVDKSLYAARLGDEPTYPGREGCALLALNFPECTKLLGPVVPGASVRCGAHMVGTEYDVAGVRLTSWFLKSDI